MHNGYSLHRDLTEGAKRYARRCDTCYSDTAISGGLIPDPRYGGVLDSAALWKAVVDEGLLESQGMVSSPIGVERGGAGRRTRPSNQSRAEEPPRAPRQLADGIVASGRRIVKGQQLKRKGRILAIDLGGTHVKVRLYGQSEERKARSGPGMTPREMIRAVRVLTRGWHYQYVSLGYPGVVFRGKIFIEPRNLGKGWVGFDFERAFGCPVRVINDAVMQAIGDYEGGRMLFLGLGTGLGTALILDRVVEPMELSHLPYKKGRTYEEYLGKAGFEKLGRKKWEHAVFDVTERLRAAFEVDYVVLGGGNALKLKKLPPGARLGDNANAFTGAFRMWLEPGWVQPTPASRGRFRSDRK